MKRSMKTAFLLLSVIPLQGALQTRLPDNFYLFDSTGQNKLLDTSIRPRTFTIIVGNTPTSPAKNQPSYQQLTSLISTTPAIPTGFIASLPVSGKDVALYFDWEDKVGFKNIRDFGGIFAKGIQELINSFDVPCIIISFGRAGLLVNNASQQWNTPSIINPLPTLIQVGTPVPGPANQYRDLLPNPAGISRLYCFYSKQPFVVDQPTLHPTYQPLYNRIPNLSVYTLLVLINNKQPLQSDLLNQLLTQNLIGYCNTAQTQYVANKNLFINLSTIKPEINGIIAIANPTIGNTTAQGTQEVARSAMIVQNLTTTLGRDIALDIDQGQFLRNSYRFQGSSK